MVHMMRKQQARYANNRQLSLAEQFNRLGAWGLWAEWPLLAASKIHDRAT